MDESTNLELPYIMAAQAQKHITHNEALRGLDALVQIGVLDKNLTAPPGSPADGDRYIPATGATGEWSGKDGQIAAWQDNAWMFYTPRAGWLAYITGEDLFFVHDGADWSAFPANDLGGTSTLVNETPHGAKTRFELAEEELTLSGAFVESTVQIPDRAIVFAVTTRTTETVTGASSYDCGIAGETSKYGGSRNIADGSNNSGVTGPTAFYADTPVRITANGSDFTGGKIRLAIHYMLCTTPTS
jgi:hypothetical protein